MKLLKNWILVKLLMKSVVHKMNTYNSQVRKRHVWDKEQMKI